MKEVSRVLEQVVTQHSYDGFIHYAQLAAWSKESGIPFSEGERLLETWPYDPATFLDEHGRGNCADFTVHTTQRLGQAGVSARVVGTLPDLYYSAPQRDFLAYQHASVVGDYAGEPFIAEPSWHFPRPIPLKTEHITVMGRHRFRTLALTERSLQQQRVGQDGTSEERIIDLQALTPDQEVAVTKQAMRMPNRRLSLTAPLRRDHEKWRILFDEKTGLLGTSLSFLPKRFHPQQIPDRANKKMGKIFGFDVKEELLMCYAVRKALSASLWIS